MNKSSAVQAHKSRFYILQHGIRILAKTCMYEVDRWWFAHLCRASVWEKRIISARVQTGAPGHRKYQAITKRRNPVRCLCALPLFPKMSQLLGLRSCRVFPQQCRTIVNRAALKPIPLPRGNCAYPVVTNHDSCLFQAGDITTPEQFLTAIGRSTQTKVTAESWNDLWKLDGHALKQAGVGVRDRR